MDSYEMDDVEGILKGWKTQGVKPKPISEPNMKSPVSVPSRRASPAQPSPSRSQTPKHFLADTTTIAKEPVEYPVPDTTLTRLLSKDQCTKEELEKIDHDFCIDYKLKARELKTLRRDQLTTHSPERAEQIRVKEEAFKSLNYLVYYAHFNQFPIDDMNDKDQDSIYDIMASLIILKDAINRCLANPKGDQTKMFINITACKKDVIVKLAELDLGASDLVRQTMNRITEYFGFKHIRLASMDTVKLVEEFKKARQLPPTPEVEVTQKRSLAPRPATGPIHSANQLRDQNSSFCAKHRKLTKALDASREAGTFSKKDEDKQAKVDAMEREIMRLNMPLLEDDTKKMTSKHRKIITKFFVCFLHLTNDVDNCIVGVGDATSLHREIESASIVISEINRDNVKLRTYLMKVVNHFGFGTFQFGKINAAAWIDTMKKQNEKEAAKKEKVVAASKESVTKKNEDFCKKYKNLAREVETIKRKIGTTRKISPSEEEKVIEFEKLVDQTISENMRDLAFDIAEVSPNDATRFKTFCVHMICLFSDIFKCIHRPGSDKIHLYEDIREKVKLVAGIYKKNDKVPAFQKVMQFYKLDGFEFDKMDPAMLVSKLKSMQTKVARKVAAPPPKTKPILESPWARGTRFSKEQLKTANAKFSQRHRMLSQYVREVQLLQANESAPEVEQAKAELESLEKKMLSANIPSLVPEAKRLSADRLSIILNLNARFVLLLDAVEQCIDGEGQENLLLKEIDQYTGEIVELKNKGPDLNNYTWVIYNEFGFLDVPLEDMNAVMVIEYVKKQQDQQAEEARLGQPFRAHVPISQDELSAKNEQFCNRHKALEEKMDAIQDVYLETIRRLPQAAETKHEIENMEKSIVVANVPDLMPQIEPLVNDHRKILIRLITNILHVKDNVDRSMSGAYNETVLHAEIEEYLEEIKDLIESCPEIAHITDSIIKHFDFDKYMVPMGAEAMVDSIEQQRIRSGVPIHRNPLIDAYIVDNMPSVAQRHQSMTSRERRFVHNIVASLRALRRNVDQYNKGLEADPYQLLQFICNQMVGVDQLMKGTPDLKELYLSVLKLFGMENFDLGEMEPELLIEMSKNQQMGPSFWKTPPLTAEEEKLKAKRATAKPVVHEEVEEEYEEEEVTPEPVVRKRPIIQDTEIDSRVAAVKQVWSDNTKFCKKHKVLAKEVEVLRKKTAHKKGPSPELDRKAKELDEMVTDIMAINLPGLQDDISQLIVSNLNIFKTFFTNILHLIYTAELPDKNADNEQDLDREKDIVSYAVEISTMLTKYPKIRDILSKVLKHFGFDKFEYAKLSLADEAGISALAKMCKSVKTTKIAAAKRPRVQQGADLDMPAGAEDGKEKKELRFDPQWTYNNAFVVKHKVLAKEVEAIHKKNINKNLPDYPAPHKEKLQALDDFVALVVEANFPHLMEDIKPLSTSNRKTFHKFCVHFLYLYYYVAEYLKNPEIKNNAIMDEIKVNAEAICDMLTRFPNIRKLQFNVVKHLGFESKDFETFVGGMTSKMVTDLIKLIQTIKQKEKMQLDAIPKAKSKRVPQKKVEAPKKVVTHLKYDELRPSYRPFKADELVEPAKLAALNAKFCQEQDALSKEVISIRKSKTHKGVSQRDKDLIEYLDCIQRDIVLTNLPHLEKDYQELTTSNKKNLRDFGLCFVALLNEIAQLPPIEGQERANGLAKIMMHKKAIEDFMGKFPNLRDVLKKVLKHYGLDTFDYGKMTAIQFVNKMKEVSRSRLMRPKAKQAIKTGKKPTEPDSPLKQRAEPLANVDLVPINDQFCADYRLILVRIAEYETADKVKFQSAIEAEKADLYKLAKQSVVANLPTHFVEEISQLPSKHRRLAIDFTARLVLIVDAVEKCMAGSDEENYLLSEIHQNSQEILKTIDTTPEIGNLLEMIGKVFGIEDLEIIDKEPEKLISYMKERQDEEAELGASFSFHAYVPLQPEELVSKNADFCQNHNRLAIEMANIQEKYTETIRRLPQVAETKQAIENLEKSIIVSNMPDLVPTIKNLSFDHRKIIMKFFTLCLQLRNAVDKCMANERAPLSEIDKYLSLVNEMIQDNPDLRRVTEMVVHNFEFEDIVQRIISPEEVIDQIAQQQTPQSKYQMATKPESTVDKYIVDNIPRLVPIIEQLPNRHRKTVSKMLANMSSLKSKVDACLRSKQSTKTYESIDKLLKDIPEMIGQYPELAQISETLLNHFGYQKWKLAQLSSKEFIELVSQHRQKLAKAKEDAQTRKAALATDDYAQAMMIAQREYWEQDEAEVYARDEEYARDQAEQEAELRAFRARAIKSPQPRPIHPAIEKRAEQARRKIVFDSIVDIEEPLLLDELPDLVESPGRPVAIADDLSELSGVLSENDMRTNDLYNYVPTDQLLEDFPLELPNRSELGHRIDPVEELVDLGDQVLSPERPSYAPSSRLSGKAAHDLVGLSFRPPTPPAIVSPGRGTSAQRPISAERHVPGQRSASAPRTSPQRPSPQRPSSAPRTSPQRPTTPKTPPPQSTSTDKLPSPPSMKLILPPEVIELNNYNRELVEKYLTLTDRLDTAPNTETVEDIRRKVDEIVESLLRRNIPETYVCLETVEKLTGIQSLDIRDYAVNMIMLKVTIDIAPNLDPQWGLTMHDRKMTFVKKLLDLERLHPANGILHNTIKRELKTMSIFAHGWLGEQAVDQYRSIFFGSDEHSHIAAELELFKKLARMVGECANRQVEVTRCTPIELAAMSQMLADVLPPTPPPTPPNQPSPPRPSPPRTSPVRAVSAERAVPVRQVPAQRAAPRKTVIETKTLEVIHRVPSGRRLQPQRPVLPVRSAAQVPQRVDRHAAAAARRAAEVDRKRAMR